jgi:hypothetical protein
LKNAFSRGLPAIGAHLAETLEELLQFHDPSTVAGVIIEPVAGSTGYNLQDIRLNLFSWYLKFLLGYYHRQLDT